MMPRNSLSLRLIAVASVWSVVALLIAGLILVELYRAASERAFDERLDVYATTIIGALSGLDGQAAAAPELIGDPRFRLPLSGWYWSVRDAGSGAVVHASASLVGDPLVLPRPSDAGIGRGYGRGPAGKELRFSQREIEFAPGSRTLIAVAGETAALASEIAAFAGQVAMTLSALGIGLVAAIFLQVRVGLKPLDRLRASFAAVRRGDAETIDEDLPGEIAPLAVELNALIASNREIVERARAHVGNLAHALKTPLSVILNEARAGGDPLAGKVTEQAQMMRTQIDHHLERARMAATRRVIGVSTEIAPVVARLVRAMAKIHGEVEVRVDTDIPAQARFRGERQDLEDMLGNLLDNACKWALGRVRLSVTQTPETAAGRRLLTISIDDDGPGLPEAQRTEAVKRGRRLDETMPGSGLGLAIVVDLAALYGGGLTLERSDLGGLRARLELPAV